MVVFYQESLNKYGRSVVSAHEVRKSGFQQMNIWYWNIQACYRGRHEAKP